MSVGIIEFVGNIGGVSDIAGVEEIVASLWTLLHPATDAANTIIMAIDLEIVLKNIDVRLLRANKALILAIRLLAFEARLVAKAP